MSKLKKLRTNKGPGHSRLAVKLLQEARSKGTTAIVAYNVVIRVSLLRLLTSTRGLKDIRARHRSEGVGRATPCELLSVLITCEQGRLMGVLSTFL